MQPSTDAPWSLSEGEFARAISLPPGERYEYSVNAIREHKGLYCLRGNDDGWCLGVDPDGKLTFPIWPHPAFAAECATDEWGGYQAVGVKLSDFLSRLVDPVAQDEYPLAVFTAVGKWVPVPFSDFKAHLLGPRRDEYSPPRSSAT